MVLRISVGDCKWCFNGKLEVIASGETRDRVRCMTCGMSDEIKKVTPQDHMARGRMPCREPGCKGIVFTTHPIAAKVDPSKAEIVAYVCNGCGRLYAIDGSAINTREGGLAFAVKSYGIITNADREFIGGFSFFFVDTEQISRQLARA